MEEESLKNLINSTIFLVKLFSGLKDKFLAEKLYNKISGFVAGYIKLSISKGDEDNTSHNHVAQYSGFMYLKNTLDSLLELLDYLEHSKLTAATPLLYARKNLLAFKLDLIRLQNQKVRTVTKTKESNPIVPAPKNLPPKNLKESSNKERIFNFIKHSPDARTRDIVGQFSILSERTVKRNLKELITEGLIHKRSKDSAVYYSIV